MNTDRHSAALHLRVTHLVGPFATEFASRSLDVMGKDFELLSDITDIETIAVNLSIRERENLKARFGGRRWRKLKGVSLVRFPNGEVRSAEITGTRPMGWAAGK